MRVLVVTPWVPGPMRPRSLYLIERLAAEHEVTLVAATWSTEDERALESVPVHRRVGVRVGRLGGLARAGLAVWSRRSLQEAYVGSVRLRRTVQRVAEDTKPDAVMCNVLRTAGLADVTGARIRLIDLDEFRSEYYAQMADRGTTSLRRLLGHVESGRMARRERSIVSSFDAVLVSSAADLRPEAPNVHLVRSVHALSGSTDPGRRGGDGPDGPTVAFVGRMSYGANHDAACWFIDRVWPLLRQAHPGIRLEVVGDAPRRALRRRSADDVRIRGRVPTVAPYYRAAQVVVVPVRMATGVQMKMIEAMSLGVPTVVSPVVARGAGVEHLRETLVADLPSEWAAHVSRLISDPRTAAEIADRARDWHARQHGRDAVSNQLRAALASVDGWAAG
ncbi:glycosyltransferase [Cellulomonas fimi]|uniref:glycosyltransferase n=1 Tax=Cellulomonas fimi TaxID=1708 RepID=UPI0023589C97|nr:glycosyltransferase [Cellulomonas fimi]